MELHTSLPASRSVKLSDWEPLNYSNMHDFETAKRLGEASVDHVQALGEIIKDHHMNKVVCVSLLHKHFNLYPDERLLRTMHENEMIIAPDSTQQAEPFVWCFAKKSASTPYRLSPVEFLSSACSVHFEEDRRQLAEADAFLQSYLHELLCRGLTNIFGLSLNARRLFKLRAHDSLIENDTPHRRRLTLSVTDPSSILNEYTQTNWSF